MAACILRTKAIRRVALSALMAWSGRALPGQADPHRAPEGYRAIPAQEVGGHLEGNAPAVGQPCDAQAITESGGQSPVMSALPPKADIADSREHVRFVPKPEVASQTHALAWQ